MQYEEYFLAHEQDAITHDLPDKFFYSGYCWYFGLGRKIDKERALSLYSEGCSHKSYKCLYSMGVMSEKSEEINNKALGYYLDAFDGLIDEARNGDIVSQRMISCYYLFGTRGVKKNITSATFWLRKSAIGGNPEAQYNLGESYLYSKGVEFDNQKAQFWLKRALNGGYSKAKRMLAQIDVNHPYKCLNLCDLLMFSKSTKGCNEEIAKLIQEFRPVRIYLGSYFCCNYCIYTIENIESVINTFKNNHVMITLVIPIVTQQFMNIMKQKLHELALNHINIIDEVTVNDYSMLDWLHYNSPFDISLGRLFMKDPRDQRIADSRQIARAPLYINSQIKNCIEQYNIASIEIDQIYSEFNFDESLKPVSLTVHSPYCYQTTGQICLYASLKKPLQQKFRANCICNFECMKMYIVYNTDEGNYLRHGRAIYYKTNSSLIKGIENGLVRYLYWAFDKLEDKDENTRSTEEY